MFNNVFKNRAFFF